MTASLVDFHCHLDLYPDFPSLVRECDALRIFTLAVTTTPKAWRRNHELASATRHVRAALGMHPQLVAERSDELPVWEECLAEARYVGEVGLDAGPRFHRSLDLQKQVFERVLKASAKAGNRILSVHSVRATKTVLDMIEKHFAPSAGHVVLHWFSGSESEARRAIDLGIYFSVNAQMIRTPRLQRIVSALPMERLLTETDGPFVSTENRPMRPSDVRTTVAELAELRGVADVEMADRIVGNLRQLVSE